MLTLQVFLLKQWQKRGLWAWLTLPLSSLLCLIAGIRRYAYQAGWKRQQQLKVPVIVVGNIRVGGAGKTPLVAAIANFLGEQGYQLGIISRGYKGEAPTWPQFVSPDSDPRLVGDETVMLAQQTGCPVIAGPERPLSAQQLIDQHGCDVIISDDGFQHFKLHRDIDIVVIDAARGLGNRWCMPSGPLRESPSALKFADMQVLNGDTHQPIKGSAEPRYYAMQLQAGLPYAMQNRTPCDNLAQLKQTPLHAIAGIGHPQRFFDMLRNMGFSIIEHSYPDHHSYTGQDVDFADSLAMITTEKDAIKLRRIETKRAAWVMPVHAQTDPTFSTDILDMLKQHASPQ